MLLYASGDDLVVNPPHRRSRLGASGSADIRAMLELAALSRLRGSFKFRTFREALCMLALNVKVSISGARPVGTISNPTQERCREIGPEC